MSTRISHYSRLQVQGRVSVRLVSWFPSPSFVSFRLFLQPNLSNPCSHLYRTEFGCAVLQNRAEVTLWPSFSTTISHHDGVTSNNGILFRHHTEGSGVNSSINVSSKYHIVHRRYFDGLAELFHQIRARFRRSVDLTPCKTLHCHVFFRMLTGANPIERAQCDGAPPFPIHFFTIGMKLVSKSLPAFVYIVMLPHSGLLLYMMASGRALHG
ncbi:hypothetical protein DER46DRAFT_287183 [Fusarium sp. MPI-SDFR-AT-0072]|nr:hypothetical protein DER46DRAFT_287183 [Fusarium sp. MPI-SDFR-AT-0072]